MAWGKQERDRQAQFRNSHSSISEVGRKPSDDKGMRNPHLLSLGCEMENLYPTIRGNTGIIQFFCERGIKWWRTSSSGDSTGLNLPTRNLASSQIACVNFLFPWARTPDVLLSMMQSIDSEVEEVIAIPESKTKSFVEFEWVGTEKTGCLEGGHGSRGAYTTSSDAVLLCKMRTKERCLYLLEWKYTEKNSTKYEGKGKSGETRFKRYDEKYKDKDSSFNGKIPMKELFYEPFYQLMRLRLLADLVKKKKVYDASEAIVVDVCPTANDAYLNHITSPELKKRFPKALSIEDVIKGALIDSNKIRFVSPKNLCYAMGQTTGVKDLKKWIQYHKDRYGWDVGGMI